MKNIHVLPTDCNITNLVIIGNKLNLVRSNYYSKSYIKLHNYKSMAMCITSDEEIKRGDLYLTGKNTICRCFKKNTKYVFSIGEGSDIRTNCKKIILTTDQDLIKYGVQAIDDEFLEWFVKNPNCEKVEVIKFHGINTSIAEVNSISGDGSLNWQGITDLRDYKIIIPERGITITQVEKKTAVEWFENSIKDLIPNDIGSQLKFKNKIEQAKEMEKQQNDKFAIKFAEWLNTLEAKYLIEDLILVGELNKNPKTKELLKIFKNK